MVDKRATVSQDAGNIHSRWRLLPTTLINNQNGEPLEKNSKPGKGAGCLLPLRPVGGGVVLLCSPLQSKSSKVSTGNN
jgi:hypothetical protein